MKTHSWYLMLTSLLVLTGSSLPAQVPADLASSFAVSGEAWRPSTDSVTATWQATGGTPGGYLQGTGAAGTNVWYLVSPANWAGDWSGFKVLKFDFSIPSRHYPDAGEAGMVVIVGTNAETMTWTGSTPLWTWTHYEMDLTPAAFGVTPEVFDRIITNVVELRILAEFSAARETVGLDNVLVTATPPEAYQTDLASRFNEGTIQGWRPVDDVTLSATQLGQPSLGLLADDWMDGRLYKIATPTNWAGDWRQFKQLNFDMRWTGEAAFHDNVELVRIFGANGHTLHWSNSLTSGVWTHRSIPFWPETFGVDATELTGVLEHVSEMWIFGEFGGANDLTYLDNIVLTTSTNGPVRRTQNLVSRFDAGTEGWWGYDGVTLTWNATNGISGGGLQAVDTDSGTARFQSPDAWRGDWRDYQAVRFLLRPKVGSRTDFNTVLQIVTWSGSNLSVTLPRPYGSWTPYTVDLTPATFGVSAEDFAAIMADVACLWITADLVSGTGGADTTVLDNVMLLTDASAGLPPDHTSAFESGNADWRYGGWDTLPGDWSFGGLAPYASTEGNPGGFLRNTDTADWTYWFTPETWAGDWRGLESASFDFKIISGAPADLFGTRLISICSPWTNLHADVLSLPVPGQWDHYEFALTPATFGVAPEVFAQVMRDVVLLGIRSEWIDGGEVEGLDNLRISKAPDAYWSWMGCYCTAEELGDENISGRAADLDGDGTDNWSEYVAGTNPTNQLDRFYIVSVTPGTHGCVIRLPAKAGRKYGLEACAELNAAPAWDVVTNGVPGGDGPLDLPLTLEPMPRFFRATVQLPD